MLAKQIAIDLGTANTVVWLGGKEGGIARNQRAGVGRGKDAELHLGAEVAADQVRAQEEGRRTLRRVVQNEQQRLPPG